MNKVEYLIKNEIPNSFINKNALFRGFISCLKPNEAVEYFNSNVGKNYDLRKIVLVKVGTDLSNHFENFHALLINSFINTIKKGNYKQKVTASSNLRILYPFLPRDQRTIVYNILINSKSKIHRKNAYKLLRDDLSSELIPLVEKVWKKYSDPECSLLIVNEFPIDFLIENRFELSNSLNEKWQIARLYLKICNYSKKYIKELKEIDPVSYLYVIVKMNINISENEVFEILNESLSDERIGLLFWAIGKLKMWSILEYAKNNIPKIEKAQLQRIICDVGS